MSELLKIYLDRLKGGKSQLIQGDLPKEVIFTDEPGIKFISSINIQGKAYIASDHLMLQLAAKIFIQLPCIICNQFIDYLLEMPQQISPISFSEIPSKIFSFQEIIREGLLTHLPQTIECKGECKERKCITPFLKKKDTQPPTHYPFSGIEQNFKE